MKSPSSNNYRQLKLSSGEELICEIMQWDDEDDATIIIRSALKILVAEGANGYRYFGFRPWMIYCEDPKHLLTINSEQIIGECIPSNELFAEYQKSIRNYTLITEQKQKAAQETQSVEVSEEILDKIFSGVFNDSDGKVIRLFPDKVH
jgi:hypothetical protein